MAAAEVVATQRRAVDWVSDGHLIRGARAEFE